MVDVRFGVGIDQISKELLEVFVFAHLFDELTNCTLFLFSRNAALILFAWFEGRGRGLALIIRDDLLILTMQVAMMSDLDAIIVFKFFSL